MQLKPLPLSGPAFQNAENFSIRNPDLAIALENTVLDESGSNVGRPGLGGDVSIGSAISGVEACHYFEAADKLVLVTSDREVYSVDSADTVSQLSGAGGVNAPGTQRPIISDDGSYVAIAGGAGTPIRWDGSSADTETMPGSPPNATHVVYLDGYWLLLEPDSQQISFAGPTSGTRESFAAADFFQEEGLPDDAKALLVNSSRELFVVGGQSTGVYQNFGSTLIPFQRSFWLKSGTQAPYSWASEDNTIFGIDHDRRFIVYQGRTPTVMSSAIDKVVQSFSVVSDCFASVLKFGRFTGVLWTFPTEGRAFYFDLKSRQYVGEWKGFENGVDAKFRLFSSAKAWNTTYAGDFENNTLWKLGLNYKSDGSNPIRRLRRSATINHGASKYRKRNLSYNFDFKRGVAAEGATVEPVAYVRFKDDNKPWSNPFEVGLGFVGDTESTVQIRNTGVYRNRQIEISCTEEVDYVFSGGEEYFEYLDS